MKVLFAVNSESISDSIIKKYQKDYREILSYKNVYYFNAIQKEIQQDKTYDRIVISVDLEPFSSNNYESIDKFLFDKLDGISDEAHDTAGNEIPIILICSDRHTKGTSFLVKLFGISVYNALLGNDRSMEEVCRLISKPRTKKEAKIYYKIDTDDVNYRAVNEDEVDELQIQNILSHFKKLGKNTAKYASSFENIAAQYNEQQLKIIVNCLPSNVKRVLESTSEKYQEFMAANGIVVQGVKSNNIESQEDKKRTGLKIDIIENKMNQTKMNGPIVIPNSVKKTKSATAKQVIAVPQAGQSADMPKAEAPKVEKTAPKVKKVEKKVAEEAVEEKKEVVESAPKEKVKVKIVRLPDGRIVKKKVIPKKKVAGTVEKEAIKTVKPERKSVQEEKKQSVIKESINMTNELEDIELPDLGAEVVPNNEIAEKPKRGRGRPRKKANPEEVQAKPKGKRGRPRKQENKIVQIDEDEMLDLEVPTLKPEQLDLESFDDTDLVSELDNKEEVVAPFPVVEESTDVAMDLSALDELDDLDDLDDMNDDFDLATEESFDEFEDYDEYGQYETSSKTGEDEKDIDELYEEDILSDETLESIEDISDDFEMSDDDTDDLLSTLDDDEDSTEDLISALDEDEEDDYLSELDDDDELMALVDENVDNDDDDDLLSVLDEEDNEMMSGMDSTDTLISDFDSDDDLMAAVEDSSDDEFLVTDVGFEENDFESSYDASAMYAEADSMENTALDSIASPIDYSMSNLNSLMTKDKKIVTFIGSSKNGVSFLINNLAEIFAATGINTAVLDMTKNRNSYYIYTQNEESLRQIAYTAIDKLQKGVAEGIRVKQNLTVYTTLPNDGKIYPNVEEILSTLVQNHSLILIDCDFDTNPAYFGSSQEIYLVQSMDILTIQPLTAFLRDLKTQGMFEAEKVRVVINKDLNVRGLTTKAIIGGMSSYNDPAMSFMTELFDKEVVKYCSIPFEEMVYARYLEGMLNCRVSLNGYSKNFIKKLRNLADMVYPLTSRQTYSPNQGQTMNQNNFSNSMNDTLSKMKKKKF